MLLSASFHFHASASEHLAEIVDGIWRCKLRLYNGTVFDHWYEVAHDAAEMKYLRTLCCKYCRCGGSVLDLHGLVRRIAEFAGIEFENLVEYADGFVECVGTVDFVNGKPVHSSGKGTFSSCLQYGIKNAHLKY